MSKAKNEKVNATFTLSNEVKVMQPLRLQIASDPFVDCRTLIKEGLQEWLIVKKHRFQQTHFNLTGVVPYVIVGFKSNGNYDGYVISSNEGDVPFAAEMTGVYFVLMQMKSFIEIQGIKNIKLDSEI